MPFERGPMRRILLVWTCCAALLPAAGAAAQGAAVQPPRAAPKIEAKTPDTKPESPSPEFARYLESLWPKAQARGVSRATFDLAFQGVTPDPKVAVVGRAQSEFAQPISAYLDGAVSGGRIRRGGELARQWAATLDAVEAFYGVPRSVVLAAWGMESNFGGYTGKTSVIRALATLAFHRQRAGYFERELIAALEMIEKDHIRPAEMLGSWAGAMGQTQFMPSSFLAYAADGDGDGKRDIWTSVPDALAVGHLGDRILGGGLIRSAWPKAETMLGRNERVEVQKRLSERGLLDGDADGRIGFKTRDAVRRFQLERGLLADGHADPAVLKELRASR